jgi:isocitrate dehydrogenase kinase/phosphatase
VNGDDELPYAIAGVHDAGQRLVHDAVLLDSASIDVLFSLSRAYFMVDMDVPSGYVDFLRARYDRAEVWLNDALEFADGSPSTTAKATTYLGAVARRRARGRVMHVFIARTRTSG